MVSTFFFQAEDGIRDWSVTGVQTCALPISDRAALAKNLGADCATADPTQFAQLCFDQSHGRGADILLITAETPSSDPVNLAAEAARDRGMIVAVGTVGMNIQRKLYYEKVLRFGVSRSYGH